MLQGGCVVNGNMKAMFQLREYFRKFMRAGIQREALRPEDIAAWYAVGKVCLYLLSICRDGLSGVMDRRGYADVGTAGWDKLVRRSGGDEVYGDKLALGGV
jgi:hypothetical protein